MYISGDGITPFTVYRFNFKPKTTPSYMWTQSGSGNYKGIDRGAVEDLYESEVTFYGNITEIDNIITQLENNREASTTPNIITLSVFNSKEDQLFGANIDYTSSITVNVVKFGVRTQRRWKVFEIKVTLQLMSAYSYLGTPQLPTKFNLYPGYKAYQTWGNLPVLHQDNSITHTDNRDDTGVFEGNFIMTVEEIRDFRSLLLSSVRDSYITLTSTNFADCTSVFGPRGGSLPMNVNVISFDDQMLDTKFWAVKLIFAEIKSEVDTLPA